MKILLNKTPVNWKTLNFCYTIHSEALKGNASSQFNHRLRYLSLIQIYNTDANFPFQIDTIEAADYPAEIHVVTTKDGYILKLHRIPDPALLKDTDYSEEQPLNEPGSCQGVVLLMHGLFSTAADFVVTGPESGLAFVLADAGFDVWMGNARGTRFSRKNLNHTPKEAAFWDFR